MEFIHGATIRVQPYFGYRSADRLIISARALRAREPRFDQSGRLRAMRTMLAQFASREAPELHVRLEIKRPDGALFSHEAVTGREGFVHFDVPLEGDWAHSAKTRWEVVSFTWENRDGPQATDGHVLSPGQDAPLAVISDIDDTIVETGITGNLRSVARNWKRVLAQWPEERIAVPHADVFYNALGGGAPTSTDDTHTGKQLPATQHPFFYVSSSPWNLFSYLVAFKKQRGLPLGPIHLRDWGLNSETFGSSSHGSHKVDAILRVLSLFPKLNFALVGDDTQGDLVAFGQIAEQRPDQLRAVFIRHAASEAYSAEELTAKDKIERAGIPLWSGKDYSTADDFLQQLGLSHDEDARRVVHTARSAGG